jgi:hypothetical protein
MKRIVTLLFLFFPLITFSQIGGEDEVYLNGDRVEAKFNGGGIEKFSEFVKGQFNYSKVKKSGRMIASFTVDVDGSLKNIKLVEMIDVDSGVELIRVLNKCPKWIPAKRGGKPISIEIKYPMVFNAELRENQVKAPKNHVVTSQENQKGVASNTNSSDVSTIDKVEAAPRYAGGLTSFYKYISANFRVPKQEGLKGKIMVSFIVEIDGSLTDIKVLKDLGYGTSEEAIRILKASPKWIPGKQNGKPVRVEYSLPINIETGR